MSYVVFVQIRKTRGITAQEQAASDVERSAHRETMESLELSETSVSNNKSYFNAKLKLSDNIRVDFFNPLPLFLQ